MRLAAAIFLLVLLIAYVAAGRRRVASRTKAPAVANDDAYLGREQYRVELTEEDRELIKRIEQRHRAWLDVERRRKEEELDRRVEEALLETKKVNKL